jgi:transcriptional regulator with XRE-family HTH domain
MSLAEMIKNLRQRRGYSQRKLSLLSGISNTEISRIEKGIRTKPSPDTLKKLASHLGVTYNDLMEMAGYLPEGFIRQAAPEPDAATTVRLTDYDYKKGLPPEAVSEIEMYLDYIRYKYQKHPKDK